MQSGYLFVEGSQAGLLVSEKITSKDHTFKPTFKVTCGKDDNLTFVFAKDSEEYLKNIHHGEGHMATSIVVKKNYKNLSMDTEHECTLLIT